MLNCAPMRLTMALVAAGLGLLSLDRPVKAGDGWPFHHRQRVWIVNQPTTTPSTALTTTPVRLTTAPQLQLGTVTTGQTIMYLPATTTSLAVTPGLTTSFGSLGLSRVRLPGTSNQVALAVAPQTSSNVVSLSVGTGGATDTDSQVVALGLALGGGNKSLSDFLSFIEGQAGNLVNQAGSNANQQSIVDTLFNMATSYLSGNGFGIVIDDVVAPIIKRLINKAVQKVQPPTPPTPSNVVVPQGGSGGTFTISGTITLTPTGQVTPNTTPGGTQPGGTQTPTGPTSLTPGGGTIAPSP
jgi:hypothetical protein